VRGALIPLVLAVLLAGCGGTGGPKASGPALTKQQYESKLEQIVKDVGAKVGGTQSDISKLTGPDLSKATAAFNALADELAKVNPPAAIRDLHARLVSTLRDLAKAFPDIVRKVKAAKDPSAAFSLFLGAKPILKLIELGSEFKAKGYNLDLSP
jgi:hypothetical protein